MPIPLDPLTISDFSAGEDTTTDYAQLAPNAASKLENLSVRSRVLKKTFGNSIYGTLPNTTAPCRWVGAHTDTTTGKVSLLGYSSDTNYGYLFRLNDPSGAGSKTFTKITPTTMARDADIQAVQLNNYHYITDKTALYIYDEANVALNKFSVVPPPTGNDFSPVVVPEIVAALAKGSGTPGQAPGVIGEQAIYNGTTHTEGWLKTLDVLGLEEGETAPFGDAWLYDNTYADGVESSISSLHISIGADFTKQDPTLAKRFTSNISYVFNSVNDLVALKAGAVNYVVFFADAPWERIHLDGDDSTNFKMVLYNGVPGDTGTIKVSKEFSNIEKGKWKEDTITREYAEQQAKAADPTCLNFWENIKAVGCEVAAKAAPDMMYEYWIDQFFIPGQLYTEEDIDVGYTYYDSTNGIESGLSPITTINLFDVRYDVLQTLSNMRFNHFGQIAVTVKGTSSTKSPDKIRIYIGTAGTWRLATEIAHPVDHLTAPVTHKTDTKVVIINAVLEDLPIASFPMYGSSAELVPHSLGRLSGASRLVALGCDYQSKTYNERVWISNFIDPLIGKGLHFPEISPNGIENPNDTQTSANYGLFADLVGSGEVLACKELGSFCYIFARNGVWSLVGRNSNEFAFERISQATGCISANSVVETENALVYLGVDNVVYSLNGMEIRPLSQTTQFPMKGLLQSIPDKYLDNAQAIYGDNTYFLSFEPGCDYYGIAYDFLTGTWWETKDFYWSKGVYVTPKVNTTDYQNDRMILVGDMTFNAGHVILMGDSSLYTHVGSNRETIYTTGLIPLAPPDYEARIRAVQVTYQSGNLELKATDQDGTVFYTHSKATSSSDMETVTYRPTLHWCTSAQIQLKQTDNSIGLQIRRINIILESIRKQA